MYQYYRHKDINFNQWDECIKNSKQGLIYGLSWYLNISSPHWDAIIYKDESQYLAVFPIPTRKKYGFKIVHRPTFCHQLGLVSIYEPQLTDFESVYKILVLRFKYIGNYQFNIDNSEILRFKFFDFKNSIIKSYHIILDKTFPELYKSLSKDRKNNILKSQRHNLLIEESHDIDKLINLFKQNIAPKIIGGVGELQYEMIRGIYINSDLQKSCKLFIIKNPMGEVMYGTLILIYKNRLIKLFTGSNHEARLKNCDSYFMNFILKEYANSNFILDLERDSSPGVNKYKESYNPTTKYYLSVRYSKLPFLIRIIRNLKNKIMLK